MSFNFFSFFGEIINIDNVSETGIKNHFEFQRPNSRILNSIKSHIQLFGQILNIEHNPYEWDIKSNYYGKEKKISKLDSANWKYLILCHNYPQDNRTIPLMLGLSKPNLTVLMQGNLSVKEDNIKCYENIYSGLKSNTYYHDLPILNNKFKTITDDDIDEFFRIKLLLDEFEVKKYNYPEIDKALSDFLQIKYISIVSPFKILSYITVLELLLSNYDPKNQTNTKITEQLQKKITQLNESSTSPINIKDYFKGPDTLNISNIIKKIYTYRNDIAHGQFSDFEDNLQILNNKRNEIVRFLDDVLKMVLIRSIENPNEIIKLKD